MLDLKNDPRWMRLIDPAFVSGTIRGGSLDFDADRPAAWKGGDPVGGEDEFDPNNFLSADFCIIDDRQFFIRGVMELPILGSGGRTLAYAIWTEVSRQSFGAHVKSFELDDQTGQPPIIGTFANRLAGFPDTLGLPCTLRLRNGNARPAVTVTAPDHPLAQQQTRGITLDQLLDLFAAAGQDLRPALGQTH